MNKLNIILLAVTFSFLSCKHFNDKLVLKHNYLYKFEQHTVAKHGDADYYNGVYTPDGRRWASITEQNSYLTVKMLTVGVDTLTATDSASRIPGPTAGTKYPQDIATWQKGLDGAIYFGPVNNNTQNKGVFYKKNKFKYLDQKILLQTLTVPIKIRPAVRTAAVGDTFPNTTEIGINFGLAFGWKGTYNVWNCKKNMLASNTNKFSLAIAGLFTTSGVDLKKSNTGGRNVFERKALVLSPGIFIGIGFNNIHLGVAMGKDYATGVNASKWVYDDRRWYGIVLALDLLK